MSISAQHKVNTPTNIQKEVKLKSLKMKLLFEIQKVLSYKKDVPKEFTIGAVKLLNSLKYVEIAEERNSINLCAYVFCEHKNKDLGYSMKLMKYQDDEDEKMAHEEEDDSKNQYEELMFCTQACRSNYTKLGEAVERNEHFNAQSLSSFQFLEGSKYESVNELWRQLKESFKGKSEESVLVKVKERDVSKATSMPIIEKNTSVNISVEKPTQPKDSEVVLENFIGQVFDNGVEKFEIIEEQPKKKLAPSKKQKEEEKKSKKALDDIEKGRQALTSLAAELSTSSFAKVYMWANSATSNHESLLDTGFNKEKSVVIKTPAEQKLCVKFWKSIEPFVTSYIQQVDLTESLKLIKRTTLKITYELDLPADDGPFTEEEYKFIAKVLLRAAMTVLGDKSIASLQEKLAALSVNDKEQKEKEDVILEMFLSTN